MKRLFVFTLTLFLPPAMVAQKQRIKLKQAGEFASFSLNTDPLTSVSLSVSRSSSTNTAPSATLNYISITLAADFNSETFVQVIGEIPASAFTGQTTRNLVLDLDTSTLDPSTIFAQSCTLDLGTFAETCGPVPTGLIHLAFQENGVQRTRILELDEEIINGSTTTHIHQTSDNSTANMQGSIFGVPFATTNANVGVNKDSSLEVIKN
jgi:hypothetical protein